MTVTSAKKLKYHADRYQAIKSSAFQKLGGACYICGAENLEFSIRDRVTKKALIRGLMVTGDAVLTNAVLVCRPCLFTFQAPKYAAPADYTKRALTSTSAYGYETFCDVYHPLADRGSGLVYLHRHVASVKVGRWLTTEEHVHHIDKVKTNNDPDNLEVLPPEEHARLHATGSKDYVEVGPVACATCGRPFYPTEERVRCCSVACASSLKEKKTGWPSPEEMQHLLFEKPSSDLAKELGVSDSAIVKFAKRHGLSKPGRGYWVSKENRVSEPPSRVRKDIPIQHGMIRGYKRGCRCEACRAANAESARKRRESLGIK